jgi:flagellar basal-body rod modification protein FlgD
MQINSARQTQSSEKQANQASGAGMSDMFMQLLVAQLKSQSPLDPLDPNQFLGQLAQFNTLSEIIKIRALLEAPATSASSTKMSSVQGGQ